MTAWPDTDGTAIERYVRQLRLRHSKSPIIYRCELRQFQRFIQERGELSLKSVTAWLQARAAEWPMPRVIARACKVNRLLNFLVSDGALVTHPFAELISRYRQRRLGPIIHALLADQPEPALEALRPLLRFGSFLGPVMQEHVEFRRSLGFRYDTQAERLAAFDRFLQRRPDLTGKALPVLLRECKGAADTIEQRWRVQLLGRDLARVWSRIDPSVVLVSPDRILRRQVTAQRRKPHIYTHQQIRQLLETARSWPSPRAPLRPMTLYTMLVLAYCAGLRIGELLRLDVGDVSLEEGVITIRESKFFKSRRLSLTESAVSALRDYLRVRAEMGGPTNTAAPLFFRQAREGGGRYSRVTASNLLVDVLRRAGLKPDRGRRGPRIHDLRHSFVSHRMLAWYRDGINPQAHLPYLATFLGHRDINSTLVYLNTTQDVLQLASERFRSYVQRSVGSAGRASP